MLMFFHDLLLLTYNTFSKISRLSGSTSSTLESIISKNDMYLPVSVLLHSVLSGKNSSNRQPTAPVISLLSQSDKGFKSFTDRRINKICYSKRIIDHTSDDVFPLPVKIKIKLCDLLNKCTSFAFIRHIYSRIVGVRTISLVTSRPIIWIFRPF